MMYSPYTNYINLKFEECDLSIGMARIARLFPQEAIQALVKLPLSDDSLMFKYKMLGFILVDAFAGESPILPIEIKPLVDQIHQLMHSLELVLIHR